MMLQQCYRLSSLTSIYLLPPPHEAAFEEFFTRKKIIFISWCDARKEFDHVLVSTFLENVKEGNIWCNNIHHHTLIFYPGEWRQLALDTFVGWQRVLMGLKKLTWDQLFSCVAIWSLGCRGRGGVTPHWQKKSRAEKVSCKYSWLFLHFVLATLRFYSKIVPHHRKIVIKIII